MYHPRSIRVVSNKEKKAKKNWCEKSVFCVLVVSYTSFVFQRALAWLHYLRWRARGQCQPQGVHLSAPPRLVPGEDHAELRL